MMAEATSQGEAMQGERTLHPDLNKAEQHVHQEERYHGICMHVQWNPSKPATLKVSIKIKYLN